MSAKRGAPQVANEFYKTPGWCTRAIIPHLPAAGLLCDAGCGDGAIAEEFLKFWTRYHVFGVEIDEALAKTAATKFDVECADFLKYDGDADLIVSNPPFSMAREFLEHSLAITAKSRGTCAFLLRLNWLASQERMAFNRANMADVFVLPRRPSFRNGTTDATDYGWFVYGPGRGGRYSILEVEKSTRSAKGTNTEPIGGGSDVSP